MLTLIGRIRRPRKIRRAHCVATATLLLGGAAVAAGLAPPAQSEATQSEATQSEAKQSEAKQSPPSRDPIQNVNFRDAGGAFSTYSTTGRVDLTNPFFQSLGANGRTCRTCHQPQFGWTITPRSAREVFAATGGRDPLFRSNDGTNAPEADVSTVRARRSASSLLLSKGLIRIGLPRPVGAEFALDAADDPYGHASPADFSLFRRPLPTANLSFLSTVMWDGRQNKAGRSIPDDLAAQALDAITGHAQRSLGQALDPAVLQSIVTFETGLFLAQTYDDQAGWLDLAGGGGGPQTLAEQPFYIGINDPLGLNPTGTPFDPGAFTLYAAWGGVDPDGDGDEDRAPDGRWYANREAAARAAVARGEALFNTKPIAIAGVAGLNDVLKSPVIRGTCTTCHDAPNVGDHSVAMPLNIGVADASRRTPDLPLYTLRNLKTGETVQTTDPGRALVTGKWADIGKFKGPILRALATRAPYFHNGSAAGLGDVVTFYDTRFAVGFTKQEKKDLVAFLRAL